MTDLAAWIASKRAASEGALRENAGSTAWAVFNAAFDPATTRRLLDAAEALRALVVSCEVAGVFSEERAGPLPRGADECWAVETLRDAKAALDALRGGGHG